ncbi:MAG: helix-turn-helix transcriptional regulator [Clostridia bacterium]|jgi:transcriptional regulator with XRE-family HTH domain|nr:helix-turn-helix transcriptional regulator [Clostridia bacterium]
MTLGERLLKYRTEAKMSQDILAEKLGVTRQTISKWETDQSTPEFNKILPLCQIYGITTDELIKGEKQELERLEEPKSSYTTKRNKQKAIVISISVFLYCMSTFSFPYMIEVAEYEVNTAVMQLMGIWTLATVILIYFFISHPKEKSSKKEATKEKKNYKESVSFVNESEKVE